MYCIMLKLDLTQEMEVYRICSQICDGIRFLFLKIDAMLYTQFQQYLDKPKSE